MGSILILYSDSEHLFCPDVKDECDGFITIEICNNMSVGNFCGKQIREVFCATDCSDGYKDCKIDYFGRNVDCGVKNSVFLSNEIYRIIYDYFDYKKEDVDVLCANSSEAVEYYVQLKQDKYFLFIIDGVIRDNKPLYRKLVKAIIPSNAFVLIISDPNVQYNYSNDINSRVHYEVASLYGDNFTKIVLNLYQQAKQRFRFDELSQFV